MTEPGAGLRPARACAPGPTRDGDGWRIRGHQALHQPRRRVRLRDPVRASPSPTTRRRPQGDVDVPGRPRHPRAGGARRLPQRLAPRLHQLDPRLRRLLGARRRAARRGGQGLRPGRHLARQHPPPGRRHRASAAPNGRSTSPSGTPPSREQFGQQIGRFQGVGFKLADMAIELRAAELMTLRRRVEVRPGHGHRRRHRDGQAQGDRDAGDGRRRGDPDPRRDGPDGRAAAGADLARRAHRADLGRHLGDPAAHHLAGRCCGRWEPDERCPSDARARPCGPGVEGGILEVTLDRPKANAIDLATSRVMGKVFAGFRDDADLRVAIAAHRGRQVLLRRLGPQGRGRRRRGGRRLRRRRLRRAPGAAGPQQAGDRGRARPGDGRRLRAGAVVRPDLRLGGHPVRPAGDQRRHPRRRGDDQAAQADAVPRRDGAAPDRTLDGGRRRRTAGAWSTRCWPTRTR